MNKVNNILVLILLGLAALAPVSQMVLIKPAKDVLNKRSVVMEGWIKQSWFHEREKPPIVTDTGNVPDININDLSEEEKTQYKKQRALYKKYDVPYGRSWPPLGSSVGTGVLFDGRDREFLIDKKTKQPVVLFERRDKEFLIYQIFKDIVGIENVPEDKYLTINSFWSFDPHFLPVQLDIEKTDEKPINWICIIPRWEWQEAYSIELLKGLGDDKQPALVVPLHYHGQVPVKYHFYCDKDKIGSGIRLKIKDAKVALNNSWGTPIYEIGAGYE